MSRYQNGKIYSIRSHQTDQVYIGSTCLTLTKRLYKHRNGFKMYKKNGKNYMTSYEILKYPDHYIELIEACPCNTKGELERREGQLIRATECVNKYIPGRTRAEYRQDNKQQQKQYYQDNAEVIKQQRKQYRQDNAEVIKQRQQQKYTCECSGKYTYCHKPQHFKTKQHRQFVAFMSLSEEQVNAMLYQ